MRYRHLLASGAVFALVVDTLVPDPAERAWLRAAFRHLPNKMQAYDLLLDWGKRKGGGVITQRLIERVLAPTESAIAVPETGGHAARRAARRALVRQGRVNRR